MSNQPAVVVPLFGTDHEAPASSAPAKKFQEIDTDFELPTLPKIAAAMKRLDQLGILYEKHGPYHLKVQNVSFWPSKGTVMLDGQQPFAKKGLDFFLAVLNREGIYRGPR